MKIIREEILSYALGLKLPTPEVHIIEGAWGNGAIYLKSEVGKILQNFKYSPHVMGDFEYQALLSAYIACDKLTKKLN